jgi:hypothetical protein
MSFLPPGRQRLSFEQAGFQSGNPSIQPLDPLGTVNDKPHDEHRCSDQEELFHGEAKEILLFEAWWVLSGLLLS